MDAIFFWLSKLVWLVIRPDSLLLIFIVISLVLLWKKSYSSAKWVLTFATVCMVLIALIPFGNILLNPLETQFNVNPTLPKQIDGIIVLAGAADAEKSQLWQQTQLGGAADRYFMFMALARQYPEAKLIFTGGSGSPLAQEYKEADTAKAFFKAQGLDTSKIIFERESRNTYENAVLSKELAKPAANENWILITTAWHMPRSIGIFCKQAWPMIPYPVDYVTKPTGNAAIDLKFAEHLHGLKAAMKEWIGLAAYYVTGKTTALLPNSCHQPTTIN